MATTGKLGPAPYSHLGPQRISYRTLTGPAAYATGGIAIDAQDDAGLNQVNSLIPDVKSGYTISYNPSTSKVQVWVVSAATTTSALVEATASTDLSSVTWQAIFIGA